MQEKAGTRWAGETPHTTGRLALWPQKLWHRPQLQATNAHVKQHSYKKGPSPDLKNRANPLPAHRFCSREFASLRSSDTATTARLKPSHDGPHRRDVWLRFGEWKTQEGAEQDAAGCVCAVLGQ